METLVMLMASVGEILEKCNETSVEKANIAAKASVDCARINANKAVMIAGIAGASVLFTAGMATKTISQIKGGKTNE